LLYDRLKNRITDLNLLISSNIFNKSNRYLLTTKKIFQNLKNLIKMEHINIISTSNKSLNEKQEQSIVLLRHK